ncbi:MAG: hypothetical protein KIS79_04305 [Burkholderiales bacterium]|nr:hypothetical protein [Burkholderiales bacterium]
MLLKLWRSLTILLTALLVSVCVAQLWEMPTRLAMSGPNWLYTMTAHEGFLTLNAGPMLQIASVGAAFVLLGMAREDAKAFWWALAAAVTLLIAFIVWWAFIYPVEMRMSNITAASLPINWGQLRLHWESAQVVRAALVVAGLSALVVSALLTKQTKRIRRRSRRYFMIS